MSNKEGDSKIFDRRNFLFNYAWSEQIGGFQWVNKENSTGQYVYLCYRAVVFFYWLGWFTVKCVYEWRQGYAFMIYFSRWGGLAEVLYFGYALVVSLMDICSIDHVQYAQVSESTNQESPSDQWDGKPACYKTGLWIFTNVMQVTALGIAIIYWVGSVEKVPDKATTVLNIHMHAVSALLILVDLFVISTPCRLLHFWNTMVSSAMYSIFTVVFYFLYGRKAKVKSCIYRVIDFKNKPVKAVLVELLVIFIAIPILHAMVYGLFRLRMCLFHSLESWKEKRRIRKDNSQLLSRSNGSQHELSLNIQNS